MRSNEPAPRRALWGLWVFFSAATIGFGVLMAGLAAGRPSATMAGAGLLAFSTLTYLFIHFVTTAHASLATTPRTVEAPEPMPEMAPETPRAAPVPARPVARGQRPQRPSDANPFNFDHLVSHTLERVTPETEAPAAVPSRAAPAFAMGRSVERTILAGAPTTDAPAPRRYEKDRVIPAAQRRNEWIGGLPLIKDVLGEAAPVTDPTRPGKTRGQCSNCSTFIWAPTQRPIRLRCPQCGKTATLEA